VASTEIPNRAPDQITYPILPAPPPALGTPDARPAVRPAQPQAQRVPVARTDVAPRTIPAAVEPVPASPSSTTSETTSTGGTEGNRGELWGCPTCTATTGPP